MRRELAVAVVRAGIVTKPMLAEIERWGLPTGVQENEVDELAGNAQEAIEGIQEALDSYDMVEIRATDLDILKRYMEARKEGKLVVNEEPVPVTFCLLPSGEYAIPWISESITDLIIEGGPYLRIGRRKVYIQDVREVYFGEMKAFMVCVPGGRGEKKDV